MNRIIPGQLWKFQFTHKQPLYLMVTSIVGNVVHYYYLNDPSAKKDSWSTKEDFLQAYKIVSGA